MPDLRTSAPLPPEPNRPMTQKEVGEMVERTYPGNNSESFTEADQRIAADFDAALPRPCPRDYTGYVDPEARAARVETDEAIERAARAREDARMQSIPDRRGLVDDGPKDWGGNLPPLFGGRTDKGSPDKSIEQLLLEAHGFAGETAQCPEGQTVGYTGLAAPAAESDTGFARRVLREIADSGAEPVTRLEAVLALLGIRHE